ncbi:MAG: VOC family protein [Acidimicrobiales bacterium]
MADQLSLISILVDDYDEAIAFFVDVLGFELIEDSPATTSVGGRPKRWVVVRPSGAETSILIAKADGDVQRAAIGNQTAGRVGFFLTVDDFDARYEHMVASGVEFTSPPRSEPYGKVAVFVDIAGNKWDLLSRPHKSE